MNDTQAGAGRPDVDDTTEPNGSDWRRAALTVLRLRATGAYATVTEVWAATIRKGR